jgi:acyl carrier protein
MKPMNDKDPLLRLLVEFFDLPDDIQPGNIRQRLVASWDSLAMVQLITELEGTFSVTFDIEEIQRLRSYDEIRDALLRKSISFRAPPISDVASTAVE